MGFANVVQAFARRGDDTVETAFEKALIFVIAITCAVCGIIWCAVYAVVFGPGITMALPLAFTVLVGGAILVSARLADHRPLVYTQLACITGISPLIQWCIGSSAASGLVICWSLLGPIGALFFLPLRQAMLLLPHILP